MRIARLIAVLALVSAGCGDGSSAGDGGPDAAEAGPDARRDAGFDAGPECPAPCGFGELCCPVADGGVACIDVREDPDNCGGCGVVCAEGRGTECVAGRCVCGAADFGCAGATSSTCCPPRRDGGPHYCANLENDFEDCGGCGEACDLAVGDRCAGSRCVCGEDDRTGCEGSRSDHCCVDSTFGTTDCVDLTTSKQHCGECNRRCAPSQVCCDGTCCAFGDCADGVCTTPMDAGTPDSGARDAGAADAGVDGAALDAAADGSG